MWPSRFVGGQSLRRALQVKPGVRRACSGCLSTVADGPLEIAAVVAFIAAYSSPIYAVLCLPGAIASLLIVKRFHGPYSARATLLFASILGLLTPVLVPGHSPLILPLPFGLWLANRTGGTWAMGYALYSVIPVAALLSLSAWRYHRRERNGERVSGWWERMWRGGRS